MHIADYIVLGAYLLLLCGVTWIFRKTSGKSREFFLGNQSFGAIPVGLSVMVTTFSAVNYLALPGEVYGYGLYVLISLPAFFLAAWPATRYWMPYFRKSGNVSVYAVLEERFDLKVRMLCASLFLIWRLFWMAVALYASCRIMSMLTGFSFLSLLLVCGLFAAFYSAVGGMKAVVWTDVIQFCVLFGSILLGVLLVAKGSDFWSILQESGKLRPYSPPDMKFYSFDPRERITLWSGLFGSTVVFLTRFGGDQMVMQRYLSAKSLEAARRGLWINGVAATLSLGLLAVFGLALTVYARRNGLPVNLPPVKVIAALLKSFPAGAAGMIAAGLLAATMSSIDSGLNSCSAAYVIDFQQRFHLPVIPSGLLTFLLSIPVMVCAAFILPALNRDQTLFVILNKTVNTIGTPLLAVMICALFWKKATPGAVFRGTLAGFLLTIFFSIALKRLSLHYYAMLSLLSTLGMILIFQIFSYRQSRSVR